MCSDRVGEIMLAGAFSVLTEIRSLNEVRRFGYA